MKVKVPDIPQPAPLPPAPAVPKAPPAPNIISPQGVTVVTRDPTTGQDTYRSLTFESVVAGRSEPELLDLAAKARAGQIDPADPAAVLLKTMSPGEISLLATNAAQSRARQAAQGKTLAEIGQPPEVEVASIKALQERLFRGAEGRIAEDAEKARQRLLEELNVRGLLGSTGVGGEAGLRGKLEEARAKALLEAGERTDILGENISAARRAERMNLYGLLGAGAQAETAQAAALTPLSSQISQVERGNQLSQFQYGPLLQFNAEMQDRAARSAIDQANAQRALQAQMATIGGYGDMAGAAALALALKRK